MNRTAQTETNEQTANLYFLHITSFEKALESKLEKIRQDLNLSLESYKSNNTAVINLLNIPAHGPSIRLH